MTIFRDILDEAARASSFKPDASFFANVWTSLVPNEIARHTTPTDWAEGVLTVEVSPTWLPEIRRQRLVLLRRIDARLPWTVHALELREGPATLAEAPSPPSLEEGDEPDEVSSFEDDELNRLASAILRHVQESETK